jgi:hypothetical protein
VRNKSRLVAQGYSQKEGIDYEETFSPVACLEAIRILLAFAMAKGFKLFQMDVKSVFLNGVIEEEVYVKQPPGFESEKYPHRVYRLKTALYGLKQAPRAWYGRLRGFLLSRGFVMGTVDRTLFLLKHGNDLLIVQIYVDDIVFGGSSHNLIAKFADEMSREFEMSMMGELQYFLGLQIKQVKDRTFVLQTKYTKDMLRKFQMQDVKPMSTPMGSTSTLDAGEDRELVDQREYRSMIGSLLYLTRRGQTYSSVCVCALVFRPRRGHHIDRPSRGSSGTYSLPMVLALGILPPRLFHFMVFLMRILLVAEWRGSLLLVLASFLGDRWFRGLPASSLV